MLAANYKSLVVWGSNQLLFRGVDWATIASAVDELIADLFSGRISAYKFLFRIISREQELVTLIMATWSY